MEFERRKKISTDLNIAPLIDVVFLLLIFFMLTANFIIQPGIKLVLPSAAYSKLHQDENIVIFITKDNDLYLNETNIALESLLEELKPRVYAAKKKIVVIKADEKINLGLAVKVMDIAKQANAEGVVISTAIEKNAGR
ncbi:MAG: biopolymer transporter ExbD [Candidatus Omnitrophota bacterium]|jgi:biopolymer transport protein ExbD